MSDQQWKQLAEQLRRRAQQAPRPAGGPSPGGIFAGFEFSAAVEAKQIAQQDAQRAAFVVDKAIQEKQQLVVKAAGEAKSAELVGEAIKKSKDYVELKRLDTAREIASILARSPNRILLDNDTLLLNTVADGRK
ncbi:Prohibitin-2, subunit of the prohibitin complex (Phb1p-Phb2p) [Cerrena zonata]|uniref:Prohibitin n=1 Tax=Cerrena zonata TaxID=2478898 RepID=A0AAW0FKS5_9APHY